MRVINSAAFNPSGKITERHLYIESCGNQKAADSDVNTIRENGLADFQIIYIWKGCGYFQIGGKNVKVPSGNIIVYKPREPQIYTYYQTNVTETYWIHFKGKGAEPLIKDFGLWEDQIYYVGKCGEINELILKILKEIQLKSYDYASFCFAYFIHLLSVISRSIAQQKSPDNNKKFEKLLPVIEDMHNHYKEDASIEKYAAICNLSKYYFMTLFKQFTGVSPYAYRTKIRLEQAKHLLLNTALTVSEIAELVGYCDPLYFSRIFKKYIGHPPNTYRINKTFLNS